MATSGDMPDYFLIRGSLINYKQEPTVLKKSSPESRMNAVFAHQAEMKKSFTLDRTKFCSSDKKEIIDLRDAKAWGKIAESKDIDASTF